jgi:hypothetical protein
MKANGLNNYLIFDFDKSSHYLILKWYSLLIRVIKLLAATLAYRINPSIW